MSDIGDWHGPLSHLVITKGCENVLSDYYMECDEDNAGLYANYAIPFYENTFISSPNNGALLSITAMFKDARRFYKHNHSVLINSRRSRKYNSKKLSQYIEDIENSVTMPLSTNLGKYIGKLRNAEAALDAVFRFK